VAWVTRDFVGGRKSAVGASLQSERSTARILCMHHTTVLGAADKRLPSPVKRRDQSIALLPIGSRRNSVLSECSAYSSVCARRLDILAPWGCAICKANRVGVRIERSALTNAREHPGRWVLLCHPRHTSTDEWVNRWRLWHCSDEAPQCLWSGSYLTPHRQGRLRVAVRVQVAKDAPGSDSSIGVVAHVCRTTPTSFT